MFHVVLYLFESPSVAWRYNYIWARWHSMDGNNGRKYWAL